MPIPTSLLSASPSDFDLEVTAGTWPADLTGEMVISGPLPDPALAHGFFGFGMMNRLSLAPGKHGAGPASLAWRTNIIDSPSRRLYERRPELFVPGPTGYTTPLGPPNMANTAPLPWGDRLFATWDVGRPSELDPVSLQWLGDAGSMDAWGGQSIELGSVFPFLFTSAHPVVDPDRDCLWTVKLVPDMARDFAQAPTIVRWDGDGATAKQWPVEGAEVAGSMHTISQTQNWLILSDSGNFKADPVAIFGGEKSVSIDDEISLYLVRKEEVDRTPPGQPVTAVPFRMGPPPGHFYGQWDDTAGVRVVFEHMDMLDLGFPIGPNDVDRNGDPVDPSVVGLYSMGLTPETVSEATLDPTSSKLTDVVSVRDDWSWNLQLSAMDWCTEGLAKPTLHHVAYHGCRPGAITRRSLDFYADRIDESAIPTSDTPGVLVTFERGSLEEKSRWEYKDTNDFITSPTFAPRLDPGGRYKGPNPGGHDGYVVLAVQNDRGFRVEIFDAGDVGAGPVAVASAPNGKTVPALLHAAWMPQAVDAVDAERMSFASELDDAVLATLEPDVARTTREIADELGG
ncbi:carotenoid oxygenase family protein [Actinospongicola halichondriae]|uniref:carotenoid oxygenase family protein n=1 Tax=Actinospongicola halichondriae TaxID=3236844 RepID=UPI003D375DB1